MRILKILLIGLIAVTLPIVQVNAALPNLPVNHEDLSLVVNEQTEGPDVPTFTSEAAEQDVWPADEAYIFMDEPVGKTAGEPSSEELDKLAERFQDELLTAEEREGFWTNRKKVAAGLILTGLVVGLIILLLAAGGSGGGGGSAAGSPAGGGAIVPPDDCPGCVPVPPGPIPHNPEPSTWMLLGLGLLVPFLRKRNA